MIYNYKYIVISLRRCQIFKIRRYRGFHNLFLLFFIYLFFDFIFIYLFFDFIFIYSLILFLFIYFLLLFFI